MIFIYPYKRKEDDFLIKLSIKCVLKHYPEARIITIGDEVEGVENMPFKDSNKIRGANVIAKCLYASQFFEEFIYMNDDFFINERFDFDKVYHSPEILDRKEGKASIAWNQAVDNSRHWLEFNNYPLYSFECHQPFKLNSKKLFKVMEQLDWQNFDCFLKSIYGNVYSVKNSVMIDNVKLIEPKINKANKFLTMYGCLSVGHGFLTEEGRNFLKSLAD